jgi:predicted Zn-dependent protease
MLTAIPDDIVALQFLGLALYQMGRVDDARHAFKRVAARHTQQEPCSSETGCEPAHCATLRAATRAHSGLADGWYRIALALNKFGFNQAATRAFAAAVAASGSTSGKLRRSTDVALTAFPDLASSVSTIA